MSEYIPPEVVQEILLRLPTKSLMKCTAVCNSWKFLIKSPAFIDTHLRRTIQSTDSHLLLLNAVTHVSQPTNEYYSLHNPENGESTLLISPSLLIDPVKCSSRLAVVGTCNGLICINAKHTSASCPSTIIWNPCIRKFVTLPKPIIPVFSDVWAYAAYAFVHDSHASDYKVLRIVVNFNCDLVSDHIPWEVEVYSLARGSWKTLTTANPPIGSVGVKDLVSVFVNGALHWFRYGKESGVVGKNNFITVFDMLSEQFSEMLVPQALTVQYDDIRISRYAELLAFIQISCFKRNNVIRIWVMEEYGVMKSWTKLFTIDLKQLSGLILKPFGIRRNGEILVDVPAVGLHSVDPKSGQAKLIRCEGVKWYCFVDSFVESLVLLGQANSLQQPSCSFA